MARPGQLAPAGVAKTVWCPEVSCAVGLGSWDVFPHQLLEFWGESGLVFPRGTPAPVAEGAPSQAVASQTWQGGRMARFEGHSDDL